MATKIIKEIDAFSPIYHFKIGIFLSLISIIFVFMFKNINNDDSISFVATFNYVEGIKNDSEVQIAGIKIGNVKKILISSDFS